VVLTGNRTRSRYVTLVRAAVASVLTLWVIWATVVSFTGGTVPLLGWHTGASTSHGVITLFGGTGVAVGLYTVVSALVDWSLRWGRNRSHVEWQ
jgi:hypothetical protein